MIKKDGKLSSTDQTHKGLIIQDILAKIVEEKDDISDFKAPTGNDWKESVQLIEITHNIFRIRDEDEEEKTDEQIEKEEEEARKKKEEEDKLKAEEEEANKGKKGKKEKGKKGEEEEVDEFEVPYVDHKDKMLELYVKLAPPKDPENYLCV